MINRNGLWAPELEPRRPQPHHKTEQIATTHPDFGQEEIVITT